jgi:hypothetical protein
MRKKALIALAVAIAIGGAVFSAYYRPPNEPWRPGDLARSTVRITVELPEGLTNVEKLKGIDCTGAGSGVLVDVDLILTAKHIVEPETSNNCEYPELGYELVYRVYFASEPDQQLATYGCWAAPVASSLEHDIAILQIRNLPDCIDSFSGKVMPTPLVIADSDSVQMGDQIYSLGFPARASTGSNGRDSTSETAIWGSGIISAVQHSTSPRDFFITTLPASSGASGGAVIDGVGHVVGVVIAVNYLNSPHPAECGMMPTEAGAARGSENDFNLDGRWQPWEWCPVSGSSWTYVTPVSWIFSRLYCIRREALLPPTAAKKFDCTDSQ